MLKAAIRDPDPVVFLENELLYGNQYPITDEVLDKDFVLPIGKAKIERKGKTHIIMIFWLELLLFVLILFKGDHITFVAHSKGVELALDAAKELSSVGIETEVINLRSLRPLDINTIIQSVVRTNHVISIEQGWPYAGIGSEIAAQIMESKI